MGYAYNDADYVSILSDDLLKVDAQTGRGRLQKCCLGKPRETFERKQ